MASHSLPIPTAIAVLLTLSGCTAATSGLSPKDPGYTQKSLSRPEAPVSTQALPSSSEQTSRGGNSSTTPLNEDLTQIPVGDASPNEPSALSQPDSSAPLPRSPLSATPANPFSSSPPYRAATNPPPS